MTIRMLNAWSGYDNGEIVNGLSGAEETRLIGLGLARRHPLPDDANTPSYASGTIIAEGTPNATLTDTIGTTATLLDFVTIPGGIATPRTTLLVFAAFDCLGGTAATKTLIVRAGPASGSFATATNFSGQTGIPTGTRFHPVSGLLWNDGSVAAQRATPSNAVNFTSAAALNTATMTIDTRVDWNIYFACSFSAAEAGVGSIILRRHYAQLLVP